MLIDSRSTDATREIAAALFGRRDAVLFRTLTSAQRVDAVKSGQVDIVVQNMTINCARLEQVAFSTEYFTARQRILVNRDSAVRALADLKGQKVCAAAGSTSLANLFAANGPLPVATESWTDCLVLLQQGQVAAVSTDDTILAGLAAQDPNTMLVGPPFSDEPYGIAIAKDRPELVGFVNGVLARMRADGTWRRLYEKWLAALGPAPAPPPARYRD